VIGTSSAATRPVPSSEALAGRDNSASTSRGVRHFQADTSNLSQNEDLRCTHIEQRAKSSHKRVDSLGVAEPVIA
jgi:hypothetical protein